MNTMRVYSLIFITANLFCITNQTKTMFFNGQCQYDDQYYYKLLNFDEQWKNNSYLKYPQSLDNTYYSNPDQCNREEQLQYNYASIVNSTPIIPIPEIQQKNTYDQPTKKPIIPVNQETFVNSSQNNNNIKTKQLNTQNNIIPFPNSPGFSYGKCNFNGTFSKYNLTINGTKIKTNPYQNNSTNEQISLLFNKKNINKKLLTPRDKLLNILGFNIKKKITNEHLCFHLKRQIEEGLYPNLEGTVYSKNNDDYLNRIAKKCALIKNQDNPTQTKWMAEKYRIIYWYITNKENIHLMGKRKREKLTHNPNKSYNVDTNRPYKRQSIKMRNKAHTPISTRT